MITQYDNILKKLEEAGHSAYYVGGCVRDGILGNEVNDIDIATSAKPDEIISLFGGKQAGSILQREGEEFGTVVVDVDGKNVEITTFRKESGYSDGRHPDKVEWTSSIIDDLSRRDLTINALALDIRGNLTDPFNGQEDILHGVIKAVSPTSFAEDSLRVLRALRFATVFGFEIETETLKLMEEEAANVPINIVPERIEAELTKMLDVNAFVMAMGRYKSIFTKCFGFLDDLTKIKLGKTYDAYDLAVLKIKTNNCKSFTSCDLFTNLAIIFNCLSGNCKENSIRAIEELEALKFPRKTIDEVAFLTSRANVRLPSSREETRCFLYELGGDYHRAERFISMASSTMGYQNNKNDFNTIAKTRVQNREKIFYTCKVCYSRIANVYSSDTFSLSSLRINGNDLISLGIPEIRIGRLLKKALYEVMLSKIPNNKTSLKVFVANENYKMDRGIYEI